jgi:hypothetical protein
LRKSPGLSGGIDPLFRDHLATSLHGAVRWNALYETNDRTVSKESILTQLAHRVDVHLSDEDSCRRLWKEESRAHEG